MALVVEKITDTYADELIEVQRKAGEKILKLAAKAPRTGNRLNYDVAFFKKFTADMQKVLVDAGFVKAGKELQKGYDDVVEEARGYYKDIGLNPSFSGDNKQMLRQMRNFDGLYIDSQGQAFNNSINKYMLDSMAGRASYDDLVTELSKIVTGTSNISGASLTRYIPTYVNTSLSSFDRATHETQREELGLKFARYAGTIIKNTRSFCKTRVGKIFSLETINSWNELDWTGKQEGRDVKIALGGWNCRHLLRWITDEMAKKAGVTK